MMRTFRRLFKFTGGFPRFVMLLLLRCPFDAALNLARAIYLKHAFDAIQTGNHRGLSVACLLFGIGSLLLFLYNGTIWRRYATYAIRWTGRLRQRLFEHIAGLPLAAIEARSGGEWITRLNADVQSAAAMLASPLHLPHAAVAIVSICVSAALLIAADPVLFGLILAFVLPHALISQVFLARPMTAYAAGVQEAKAENTTDLGTFIACADISILYGAQEFLLTKFRQSSLNIRSTRMKMQRRNAVSALLLPLMGMGGYLAVLLIGGARIGGGEMTFGTLTAVFQYRGGLMMGLMMIFTCMMNLRASLAGVNRVRATMEIPLEENAYGRAPFEDRRNRRIFSRIPKGHQNL